MERREFLKLMSAGGVLAFAAPACDLFPSSKNAAIISDLPKLDAIAQAALVQKGELSSLEAIEAAIDRIEAVNPKINAVVTKSYDMARARIEASHKGGHYMGKLWSVPYLIKDLTAYKGVRWTSGTRVFKDRIAKSHTPFVDDIERAGLMVLGKTNTPEFGLISSTESLALGPCRTPWNLDHSSGGSSGGAASAVAARIVPAAQASDGGGSIRLPATNCGIFGLKPSRGRFGNQYPDSPKPPWEISIAHTVSWSVRDSALILALTEKETKRLKPVGFVNEPVGRKLKIAVSMRDTQGNLPHPEVRKAVQKAMKLLDGLGHQIIPVKKTPLSDPEIIDAFLNYWSSGAAETRDALAKQTGKDMNEWLEPWTLGLAQKFDAVKDKQQAIDKAVSTFKRVQRNTRRFLKRYDVWLSPVASTPPPKIGEQAPDVDFDTLYDRVSIFAAHTPLHNAAGTPAMSVPMHWTAEDLPVGVQLAADFGGDALLLQLAYQMEAAQPWADRLPKTHA